MQWFCYIGYMYDATMDGDPKWLVYRSCIISLSIEESSMMSNRKSTNYSDLIYLR